MTGRPLGTKIAYKEPVMKTLLTSLIALTLILAGPTAPAQDNSEAALVDQVSSIRLEIERLDDARKEVVLQRTELAGRLSKLASQIKQRKAERKEGGILPDLPLQEMLRRSQELSDTLTLITREMEALNQARKDRLQKLSLIYDRLVERTARSIRKASGARKAELLKSLAEFRTQRDRVRRELMPHPKARPPIQTEELLASDDPDELRERADAVRDEQDRLRRRLKRVDRRIARVQADRRLEREMQDFQEDQALFGEEGRILSVTRTKTERTEMPTSFQSGKSGTENRDEGEPGPADDLDADAITDDGALPPAGGEECYGGQCGTPGLDGPDESGGGGAWQDPHSDASIGGSDPDAPASVEVEVTSTQEGRVPVGVDAGEADLERMSPAKRVKWLKKRRAQIVEQIKKLQILHDRIQEKAEQIEEE